MNNSRIKLTPKTASKKKKLNICDPHGVKHPSRKLQISFNPIGAFSPI